VAADLTTGLRHRLAVGADGPALAGLMERAITELLRPYLSSVQIAASRSIMGLDAQLIADGTYFVIEHEDRLVGCGGWSRRATLYGGGQTSGRDPALLDPLTDAARIRAMYTDPDFTRRGIGRLILSLCETAAQSEGFRRAELMATLAGAPLYRACGYHPVEELVDARAGAPVPLIRMAKQL
jgi:GNAT superfamily N-acetyltransferase